MTPEERIELHQKLDAIQTALIAAATQDEGDMEPYPSLRRELLTHPSVGPLMPEFVRRYPDLGRFWPFIKRKFGTYAERREFIWDEFSTSVQFVEGLRPGSPSDASIENLLSSFDKEHVAAVWQKGVVRRSSDPEGAITAARTLLESVCKHILDEDGVEYADDASLPALYRAVARQLRLAPDQHAEQVFKQILGGCQTVVEGLGAVRNRYSDAHGKGRRPVRPTSRHAELAVNLAGAMATFLVSSWLARQDSAE